MRGTHRIPFSFNLFLDIVVEKKVRYTEGGNCQKMMKKGSERVERLSVKEGMGEEEKWKKKKKTFLFELC